MDARTTPLVEVTRGPLVESRHRGAIAVVDAAGELVAGLGDVEAAVYYRSAAKPFQTIPLVAAGVADHFGLTPREVAVTVGSHSGEPIHLEAVARILDKIGLDASALRCGAHMPFDEASASELRDAGRPPTPLHNNCSGKHAGMLALARFLGAPVETYLDPSHPVQQHILVAVARFADVPVDEITVAVDGCSAPVFGLRLRAMARSFAQLVVPEQTDLDPRLRAAAERVVSCMTLHPEMVGGTRGRLDTDLMQAARGGIVSKVGAEGVQLLGARPTPGRPRGLGLAIKIEDGDIRRARDPVVVEALRQLGLLDDEQLAALAPYARSVVFNHRRLEVGEVRPNFRIEPADR